ncbi:Transmembrane protease serine 11A, partial [Tupaia chinensis]
GSGTRSRDLKPWMIGLLVVLSLTVVAVTIGLLVHFLVPRQKTEYYRGTFKISDLRVNSNSGQSSTYQFKDLKEMSEYLNLISVKFPAFQNHQPEKGCGKRVVPLIVNRIMSGVIAAKAAWPWQASLQRDNVHQCGGTLISNTWLVTAAHCFKKSANPREWTVSFGNKINPPLMKRNIKRIIVHEKYHSPAREYDIAVVQFSPRVTFSDDIRRICLPEASASFQSNATVYITGFGALFYGGESQNDLREARLKMISNEVCKQPQVYGNDIKFGMFCAGYLEGIYDACRGDSGGPLVAKDLKDTWYLIGIVSWGDNCGQRNKPGVYTDVIYYRNWIASKTGL